MTGEEVVVERNGSVTTITINRPQARNACTVAMVKALHDAFMEFEADPNARVAVLTGAGGTFCAGADLKELAAGSALGFCWAGQDKGVTRRMLAKPVIAAVSGHAVAAGLALAVWCDLRVADETAVLRRVLPALRRAHAERLHGPAAAPDRPKPSARHDAHGPCRGR